MLGTWVWTNHSRLTSGFLHALWQEARVRAGNVSPRRGRRRIVSKDLRHKYPRKKEQRAEGYFEDICHCQKIDKDVAKG